MRGARAARMHGVPYCLKDILDTAGIRTTAHRNCSPTTYRRGMPWLPPELARSRRHTAGQDGHLGVRAWRTVLGRAVPAGTQSMEPGLLAGRLVVGVRRSDRRRFRAGDAGHRHRRLDPRPRPPRAASPASSRPTAWSAGAASSRTASATTMPARWPGPARTWRYCCRSSPAMTRTIPAGDVPTQTTPRRSTGEVKGWTSACRGAGWTRRRRRPRPPRRVRRRAGRVPRSGRRRAPVALPPLQQFDDAKKTIAVAELFAIPSRICARGRICSAPACATGSSPAAVARRGIRSGDAAAHAISRAHAGGDGRRRSDVAADQRTGRKAGADSAIHRCSPAHPSPRRSMSAAIRLCRCAAALPERHAALACRSSAGCSTTPPYCARRCL